MDADDYFYLYELINLNNDRFEALIRVLAKKGITTEDDIVQEVINQKKELDEKIRKLVGGN